MSEYLWNVQARFYGALRANPISQQILQEENQALMQLMHKIPKKQIGKLLDVGAGEGNALGVWNRSGLKCTEIYAVDYSEKMLQRLQKKIPVAKVVRAHATHLPFADETFEVILCVGVSEYVQNIALLLKELARVLVQKGFLLITASTRSWLNVPRYLYLHPLFLRKESELLTLFEEMKLSVLSKSETHLQMQFLLQKETALNLPPKASEG